jgi:hypothetical protein
VGILKRLLRKEGKALECRFRGEVVPVTRNVEDFIRIVGENKKPLGLHVRIRDFTETYGRLLHSGDPWGTRRSNPFEVNPAKGPCRLVCERCEMEFAEDFIAALGPDSLMASFGAPVYKRCPKCGSTSVVIVFSPALPRPRARR